jgi:integrase/recombinase XerD
MTPRHQALEDDLALRQAMGFKMHDAHRLLSQFVDFLNGQGATCITTEWAVGWATQPGHVQPAEWARRLRLVRGFAQYQCANEPRTQVPSPHLLPYRPQRHIPYLSSDAEIAQLIEAASRLPSATGLRACTYVTLFALLAVTGMRSSALLALDRDEVDPQDGLLTIRHTTFRKSRCLPLHPTTQQALCHDGHRRD